MSNREAVAAGIRDLCNWAAAARIADFPPEVMARAVRVLADDIGAIVGARDEPEVAAFHEKILSKKYKEEATIFRGKRLRTDRLSAAVANATAADWLELDEGYRPTPCHAGLYVLPALLAEAELRNLPLQELLRALVLGYEVVTRVARGWDQPVANMQSHGRYCAVGAAAGISLAQKKDLLESVSTAVTLIGPAPRNHLALGILSRNVWPAAGALSGMMAVEWAECGIGGDPGAFQDVYGTVLGGIAAPARLTDGLGKAWAIMDGYTKVYACCQHLHSAVEAAIGLRGNFSSRAFLEGISKIHVETHALALPLVNANPHTTLAAKFSMSHAMAAALSMGSGGADAFAAATLDDPGLARLRGRVSVAPYAPIPAPPNDRPARVTVELADGRRLQRECLSAAGGPDRPLPVQVVLDKVRVLASPVYPRMLPKFEEMLKLKGLEQGWADIVTEMCT